MTVFCCVCDSSAPVCVCLMYPLYVIQVRQNKTVMASMESCFKDKKLLTSKIKRNLQGIVARLDSTWVVVRIARATAMLKATLYNENQQHNASLSRAHYSHGWWTVRKRTLCNEIQQNNDTLIIAHQQHNRCPCKYNTSFHVQTSLWEYIGVGAALQVLLEVIVTINP